MDRYIITADEMEALFNNSIAVRSITDNPARKILYSISKAESDSFIDATANIGDREQIKPLMDNAIMAIDKDDELSYCYESALNVLDYQEDDSCEWLDDEDFGDGDPEYEEGLARLAELERLHETEKILIERKSKKQPNWEF